MAIIPNLTDFYIRTVVRTGTRSELDSVTPTGGELLYSTDTNRLYLGTTGFSTGKSAVATKFHGDMQFNTNGKPVLANYRKIFEKNDLVYDTTSSQLRAFYPGATVNDDVFKVVSSSSDDSIKSFIATYYYKKTDVDSMITNTKADTTTKINTLRVEMTALIGTKLADEAIVTNGKIAVVDAKFASYLSLLGNSSSPAQEVRTPLTLSGSLLFNVGPLDAPKSQASMSNPNNPVQFNAEGRRYITTSSTPPTEYVPRTGDIWLII